jgi:hypothetical protein
MFPLYCTLPLLSPFINSHLKGVLHGSKESTTRARGRGEKEVQQPLQGLRVALPPEGSEQTSLCFQTIET